MVGVIIVTHGEMSKGIESSIELIIGSKNNLQQLDYMKVKISKNLN